MFECGRYVGEERGTAAAGYCLSFSGVGLALAGGLRDEMSTPFIVPANNI